MTDTPRSPSVSVQSPPSSSRSSLSLDRSSVPRRNRAALRNYYKLKSPTVNNVAPSTPPKNDLTEAPHELDGADFDAQTYVDDLLAKEPLEKVLRIEASLVNAIRGLDGERKALVYDNYSKLIDATDTIRKMRTSMEPLTPITSTLTPALASIAQTSKELSGSLTRPVSDEESHNKPDVTTAPAKLATVRWALNAPRRLEQLIKDGKRGDAEMDWAKVKMLLDKWEGVSGVEDLRRRGTEVLRNG